jgi:hypothetical protein
MADAGTETVGVLIDGKRKRTFTKPELIEYLKAESDRARRKIQAGGPVDQAGLRARFDACQKMLQQVSPMKESTITQATEAGEWNGIDFPIDVPKHLATLADELMIAPTEV